MLVINEFVNRSKVRSKSKKAESKQTDDNTTRIESLEITGEETRKLCKATLGMCITIGDGMIQNGINGDFKKDFCEKREKAMDLLE